MAGKLPSLVGHSMTSGSASEGLRHDVGVCSECVCSNVVILLGCCLPSGSKNMNK